MKIDGSSALRRDGDTTWYRRDAGDWAVDSRWSDGQLLSVSDISTADGKILTPCTQREWSKDNGAYAPEKNRLER